MDQLEYLWCRVKNTDKNHLERLIELYPDKPWSWEFLSRNPNIGLKFMSKNTSKPWRWDCISTISRILKKPNTQELILSNLELQKKIKWKMLSLNRNLTWNIVSDHIDKPWKWLWISSNPNIGWEIVEKNPQMPWDWTGLSGNPNIGLEITENISRIDWKNLSGNPNITCDFVEKHLDKDWDWNSLSGNSSITIEFIEKYPQKPWSWYWISNNRNITWEFVSRHLDKSWYWSPVSWTLDAFLTVLRDDAIAQNWEWLSKNIRNISRMGDMSWITWDIVEKNIHRDWNWFWVSINANITLDIVENNPTYPWNWTGLSRNPNMTCEFISKNLLKQWDWAYLSGDSNIICEFISNKHLYTDMSPLPWQWWWDLISRNKYITPDFVKNNINEKWEWDAIFGNPNFGLDFVRDYPTNYTWLSQNPNITSDFIIDNIHQDWNWELLSRNLFGKHPEVKARNKKLKARYYHLALELFLWHIFPSEIIVNIIRFI